MTFFCCWDLLLTFFRSSAVDGNLAGPSFFLLLTFFRNLLPALLLTLFDLYQLLPDFGSVASIQLHNTSAWFLIELALLHGPHVTCPGVFSVPRRVVDFWGPPGPGKRAAQQCRSYTHKGHPAGGSPCPPPLAGLCDLSYIPLDVARVEVPADAPSPQA